MNPAEQRPLAVALMGPTACGKTDLALLLSRRFPVEVISVDSALIYRGMDIGTAKPDAAFLKELPHHLIDIRNPDEPYSVAEFRRDALELMTGINERGNIPLLVGGTMMYFKVLRDGLADLPATDPDLRRQISEEAELLGWPAMYRKLQQIDPDTAAQLHPNHSQRIQRALEVFYSCGETLSVLQSRQCEADLPFRLLQLALWPDDRILLHQRIKQRFENMLRQGFLAEVENLRASYRLDAGLMSMRAVGYRQVWDYLEGNCDYDEMVRRGVAATRQLAKRQLTWLRKWPGLVRLGIDFEQSAPLDPLIDRIARNIEELSC